MNHPAEMALYQYMEDAVKGTTTMSDDTIQQVAQDVSDALSVSSVGAISVMGLAYVCLT